MDIYFSIYFSYLIFKRVLLVRTVFFQVFTLCFVFSSGYLLQRIVQFTYRCTMDGGGRRMGIGFRRTRIRPFARRESDPSREIQ